MAPKDTYEITPELLLHAYAAGVFPMARDRDEDEVFWVDPPERGIMPLDGFHTSRSLAREMRKGWHRSSVNTAFSSVVRLCAARPETWINATIFDLYADLHRLGFAHSVEIWDGPDLVGGVYGVALGGAFFGESMFSRRTNASKIALACLVARLNAGGFELFDVQFLTDHLASLGALEIPRADYRARLERAIQLEADFFAPDRAA
jgi:leucyl/phenylalanyl-tRNA--protein transferase